MTTLHLGVKPMPYRHAGPGFRGRGKMRKPAVIGALTSYDVAVILEHKYQIMQHFFKAHAAEIVQIVFDSMLGGRETALMTGEVTHLDPTSTGMNKIIIMFNRFLDEKEMDGLGVHGVPTLASIHGVNHRFKHPYARRNPTRPSFIDTGLYENSFRAWVD